MPEHCPGHDALGRDLAGLDTLTEEEGRATTAAADGRDGDGAGNDLGLGEGKGGAGDGAEGAEEGDHFGDGVACKESGELEGGC